MKEKEYKLRNRIHVCKTNGPQCLVRFIQTRGKDQESCLKCLTDNIPLTTDRREQLVITNSLAGQDCEGNSEHE